MSNRLANKYKQSMAFLTLYHSFVTRQKKYKKYNMIKEKKNVEIKIFSFILIKIKFYKMALPNIFTKEITQQIIARINKLTPASTPLFGKMNVSQMLAHCNVTYELVYESKHKKPSGFMKFILKNFIKKHVTNEVAYKPNGRTAPEFLITIEKEFDQEKNRLINYITKTQEHGEAYFEQKESHGFGMLNATEWNNMFYKHLNHHLGQFAV